MPNRIVIEPQAPKSQGIAVLLVNQISFMPMSHTPTAVELASVQNHAHAELTISGTELAFSVSLRLATVFGWGTTAAYSGPVGHVPPTLQPIQPVALRFVGVSARQSIGLAVTAVLSPEQGFSAAVVRLQTPTQQFRKVLSQQVSETFSATVVSNTDVTISCMLSGDPKIAGAVISTFQLTIRPC